MSSLNFPKKEEEILKLWRGKEIFKKSLKKTEKGKFFVFFEGPPTANGLPGIHHVLARVFKDLIPRYKTMQGYFCLRKAGWDTHGLPVELEVEKKLGFKSKQDIEKYGIEKFNQECRQNVWKYKEEWEKLTERIGFWLDLENPYITYENDYIESVWWIIKNIWDKKLIYQDYKVVPYCPRCGTSLSSHELAQGYKENTPDPSVYVKFKIKKAKVGKRGQKRTKKAKEEEEEYFLAWTTTPWTLPGNVALAIDKAVDYVKVENEGQILILAKERLDILKGEYKILEKFKGKKLVGMEYEPLYSFVKLNKKAHFVTEADFVTLEEGTGIVHTAVMYGVEDFELGKKIDLPRHHLIDLKGKFIKEAGKFAGQFVKDADPEITKDLEERELIYLKGTINHTYPFCWRCDTPLLYYAKTSWFVAVSKVKKALIKNNQKINWVPSYLKEGRFGEWLQEVKDWAISRERYWGTPLPIWECSKEGCGHKVCIGGKDELKKLAAAQSVPQGMSISQYIDQLDLHRPYIDELKLVCKKCDGIMFRVKELIDVWFDSGSMPYAQGHYPFENKDLIDKKKQYPADYISEAIDQTRGWFYTLLAIATLLGKEPPYKNVVCLGHILDEKGQKMSKSKGNVLDPWQVINKWGADALRWYLYTMNQPGDSKSFMLKDLEDGVKKNFLLLENIYRFYEIFSKDSNKEDWPRAISSKNILDRWILARLHLLIKEVTVHLDSYQITEVGRKISRFIDDLSTWYLRRSRERFKQKNRADLKNEGLSVLAYVIRELTKLMAPLVPFLSEDLYQRITEGKEKESVHLCAWPKFDEKLIYQNLISEMEEARAIVELAHSLRAEVKIKVRQPLGQLLVQKIKLFGELEDLIRDEVNVKEFLSVPKLPHGFEWKIKENGKIKVALDTTITDELKHLGFLRELVRQINEMRKEGGLTVGDEIVLKIKTEDKELKEIINFFNKDLKRETLSRELDFNFEEPIDFQKEISLEGKKIELGFKAI